MGKETQRRPSNTGADGPAFAAPETHSSLKGSGVSCGFGRRWALPRGCGSRAQAAPNSVGASTEGTPPVPDGRLPGVPPRTRLTVGLEIPPPWRGRCQVPDSPRGFGHGLSCRRQHRYRRFRPPTPPPAFPAVL